MKHILITGASRGLGKALAEELANDNITLTLISRDKREMKIISELIRSKGSKSYLYSFDLYRYNEIENLLKEIISSIDIESYNSIILINNASTINPINPFYLLDEKDIERHLRVNCIAPILLMSQFLSKTNHLNIERRIINISSGVVRKPIYGWSLYSAAKSAVHSIVENISKEIDNDLLKVVSFDPGVMDTNMQQSIRSVTKDQFKDVDVFRKFHTNNELRNTKNVAEIINNRYINNWMAKNTFERIGDNNKE